jgi:hypothetical protein
MSEGTEREVAELGSWLGYGLALHYLVITQIYGLLDETTFT